MSTSRGVDPFASLALLQETGFDRAELAELTYLVHKPGLSLYVPRSAFVARATYRIGGKARDVVGRMQVDLLLTKPQRSATFAKSDDLHSISPKPVYQEHVSKPAID